MRKERSSEEECSPKQGSVRGTAKGSVAGATKGSVRGSGISSSSEKCLLISREYILRVSIPACSPPTNNEIKNINTLKNTNKCKHTNKNTNKCKNANKNTTKSEKKNTYESKNESTKAKRVII